MTALAVQRAEGRAVEGIRAYPTASVMFERDASSPGPAEGAPLLKQRGGRTSSGKVNENSRTLTLPAIDV